MIRRYAIATIAILGSFFAISQIAHAAETVIIINSTSSASTTWTVPDDWNNASNTIEIIGGGGGGHKGSGTGNSGGGGGGGAYAKIVNFSTSTGNVINIDVGNGGAATATGTITFFGWNGGGASSTCNASTMLICAMPGSPGIAGGAGGLGGPSSTSVGTTRYAGGRGANQGGTNASGGGGGGAAGYHGNGNYTSVTTSTTGGSADAGFGGAGGSPGNPGGSGGTATQWTSNPGGENAGAGGGGGGGNVSASTGGIGGLYGGGGGGGGRNSGSGGRGMSGVIIITYTPVAVLPGTPGTPTYSGQSSSTPGNVTITWTAGSSTTYYNLNYTSSSGSGPFVFAASTTATTSAQIDLAADTTYWYQVQGVNGSGTSSWSASSSVLTYPGQVGSAPTYTSITTSSLGVNWNAPTGGADYYNLNYATSTNGPFTFVASSTATSTTHSGRAVNTQYTYQAQGVNGTGAGLWSATSSIYTLSNVPGAPTLSSSTTSTLAITNNQNSNPSNTLFAIQATSTPSDANWNGFWVDSNGASSTSAVWMSDATLDTVVVNNLQASTTYTFAVKAQNGDSTETVMGPTGQGATTGGTPANTCVAVSGGGNWTSASTWTNCGGAAPTAGKDVWFNSSSGNVTIDSGAVARSVDLTGGGSSNYTGILTHTAGVTLTIGDNTAGYNNVALEFPSSGWTYSLGSTTSSAISFVSTSTSQQTVNFGGKATGNVTFSAASGGSWKYTGSQNSSGTLTFGVGTLDTNGQTISVSTFIITSTGSSRTLTMGSSTINLSGTGTALNLSTNSGLTITSNTATMNFTGAGGDASLGTTAKNWGGLSMVFTNGGAHNITGNGHTIGSLSVTASAVKTDTFTFNGTLIVTNSVTFNGDSAINRLLVAGVTLGTTSNLNNTGATMSMSNVDFRDIDLTVAYDASGVSGGSGDCGGNTDITFSTAQTNYWVGGTGSWSVVGEWANASGGAGGTGRVPLCQDNARFDASSFSAGSQTVTNDMPRMGKNIDFTGVTNTPNFTISTAPTIYGSLTLASGTTLTTNNGPTFEGRGSSTITSAGKSFSQAITIQMIGGTLTMQDALTLTSNRTLTLSNGTLDANGFDLTTPIFASSNSNTRAINMGSGIWTLSGTGTIWNTGTTTGLTLSAESSTIVVSDISASSKTFAGGGLTFNDLTITGGGTGAVIFTGSNTFDSFTINPPKDVRFTAVTTTTLSTFIALATSTSNMISVSSTIATSTASLVKSGGGTVCGDYLDIQNIVASPGSTWYAGANSVDVSGNSGWIFTACPAGDTTPPTPDPMTFSSNPSAQSTSSITMTATTATDASSTPVSYLFAYSSSCASDNGTGGASSSWQAGTSYTNNSLQVNKCYVYSVKARDSAGTPNETGPSATSTAYTLANVPGAPTLSSPTTSTLAIANNANGNPSNTLFAVQVTSTSPSDTAWNGYWVDSTGASSTSAVWMSDTTLDSVVVKNLKSNTTYTFTVKAQNGDSLETAQGSTSSSLTLANIPGTPTYTNVSTSTLVVNWTAPTGGATSYKVERATSSQVYAQIASGITNTSTTDSDLNQSSTYYYRVRGTNASGDGPYSASSSVTTTSTSDTIPPSPNPMTFSAAPAASSTTAIIMTATTANETSSPPVNYLFTYSSSCSTDNGTGGSSSTWQSGTSYADTGLDINKCYVYSVKARDSAGTPNETGVSATSTAYTLANVPGAPTLSSPTTSTLAIANNANSNPSNTLFAVQVTSTSPTDSAWNGYWVDSTGASSTSAVWMSDTTLDSVVVKKLATSTTYTFTVKAQNGDSISTAQGATGQGTTNGDNSAPNAPSGDLPVNTEQNLSTTPIFKMTATDPNSDTLRYKVVIYSNSGCTTAIQTNDQNSSQTGWSGQNASSSTSYTSGSQGTYTTQSALAQNTTYYWQAFAIDPAGSNSWSSASTCQSFATTYGNWTTDSGSWSISSNQLVVSPNSGSSVQLHVTGQSTANVMVDVKMKSSAVGANTGNSGVSLRADTGANRYQLAEMDAQNSKEKIGKRITNAYSLLTSSTLSWTAATFYQLRASLFGSSLQSWANGGTALSTSDGSLAGAGFLGIEASSTNGSVTFTYDNFAVYTSSTISLTNLPTGGSWSVRNSAGTNISCQTGSTWNASTYNGQIPIDYDNGGGSVAVWSGNNTCNGTATAIYPSAGLAVDIFGGDVYAFATSTGSATGRVTTATSGISVTGTGLISY